MAALRLENMREASSVLSTAIKDMWMIGLVKSPFHCDGKIFRLFIKSRFFFDEIRLVLPDIDTELFSLTCKLFARFKILGKILHIDGNMLIADAVLISM